MIAFVGRRLIRIVLSLVVVSVVTFGLLQMVPGSYSDIAAVQSGDVRGTSGLHARYGSDVSPWTRYLRFMWGLVRLDMGPSLKYSSQSVQSIIGHALPVSATLAVNAVVLALVIAIPIGIISAARRNGRWDYWSMFAVTVAHSVPSYLLALILILGLSRWLHLLPTSGWNGLQTAIMPTLALALPTAAVLARYLRSSMIEALREDYVLAAMARGGSTTRAVLTHALRNSLIALVTVTGPTLASLATGTVFIETIFRIPGLGRFFTDAATSRDVPLLMGATMCFAAILMLMNLLVDITYGVLDPRIRAEQTGPQR